MLTKRIQLFQDTIKTTKVQKFQSHIRLLQEKYNCQ